MMVLHNGNNLCLWPITMIAFLDGWRYFEKLIQIFESKTNNQMIESNINFLSFVQWENSKFQICWRLDSSFHLSTFPLLHCMLCCQYILRTRLRVVYSDVYNLQIDCQNHRCTVSKNKAGKARTGEALFINIWSRCKKIYQHPVHNDDDVDSAGTAPP